MEYRRLGQDGFKVSAVGLGAWQWGSRGYWRYGDRYGKEDLRGVLEAARKSGIDFIDTAEIYGRGESERLIGEMVPKEEFVIATKFFPLALTPSAVERHAEKSLRRLGVRTIDLYQVHWHNPLLSLKGTMKCLERLVKQGKVRYIGVSNFDLATLKRAREFLSTTDIISNQVRYNVLVRVPETNGMVDYCKQEKIAIISWSPLEQGVLTGRYAPGAKVEGWRRINRHFRDSKLKRMQPLLEELRTASAAHGHTVAQGALAWLLRQDNVIIIPGATREEQVLANSDSVGWGFTAEELLRIDRAHALYEGRATQPHTR